MWAPAVRSVDVCILEDNVSEQKYFNLFPNFRTRLSVAKIACLLIVLRGTLVVASRSSAGLVDQTQTVAASCKAPIAAPLKELDSAIVIFCHS
jgi:hypothetical protein